MKQVQGAVAEGKAKIEERFEEFTKEFIESLEREKRLVEGQYVSHNSSTDVQLTDNFFLLSRMSFTIGQLREM